MIISTREDVAVQATSRFAVVGPGLCVVASLAMVGAALSLATNLDVGRAAAQWVLLSGAPFVIIRDLASTQSFQLVSLAMPIAAVAAAFLHAAAPRRWTRFVSVFGFLAWVWCQFLVLVVLLD